MKFSILLRNEIKIVRVVSYYNFSVRSTNFLSPRKRYKRTLFIAGHMQKNKNIGFVLKWHSCRYFFIRSAIEYSGQSS